MRFVPDYGVAAPYPVQSREERKGCVEKDCQQVVILIEEVLLFTIRPEGIASSTV